MGDFGVDKISASAYSDTLSKITDGLRVPPVTFPGNCGADPHFSKGMCMQVCCKVYGLTNASLGVECSFERDFLAVGQCFQYNNRVYVIVSVVESQGRWFANVVPENQRQMARRSVQRRQDEVESHDLLEEWRQRVVESERKWHILQEEHAHFGARLDQLMELLEHLTKEPDAHQHERPRPSQQRRGGEHVR